MCKEIRSLPLKPLHVMVAKCIEKRLTTNSLSRTFICHSAASSEVTIAGFAWPASSPGIWPNLFTRSSSRRIPKGHQPSPHGLALGALIIKERLGVSDEEAVEQIRENPYLQYFLGFHEFRDQAPFDPSMYVHFRKRFSLEQLGQINEAIAKAEQAPSSRRSLPGLTMMTINSDTPSGGNRGKLLIDATCAPADIRYPTDISLVNEAREKSEQIIDTLFEPLKGSCPKPRTYRQKARRLFLSYAKTRKRFITPETQGVGTATALSGAQPQNHWPVGRANAADAS